VLSRTNKHPTGYIRLRNTKMTSAEPRLQLLNPFGAPRLCMRVRLWPHPSYPYPYLRPVSP
jgi:hypothetical protein